MLGLDCKTVIKKQSKKLDGTKENVKEKINSDTLMWLCFTAPMLRNHRVKIHFRIPFIIHKPVVLIHVCNKNQKGKKKVKMMVITVGVTQWCSV